MHTRCGSCMHALQNWLGFLEPTFVVLRGVRCVRLPVQCHRRSNLVHVVSACFSVALIDCAEGCALPDCRIDALPQTIKHLVVVSTVPVVFPKLPLSEATFKALDALPFVKGALQKTGLAAGIVDKYARPHALSKIARLQRTLPPAEM